MSRDKPLDPGLLSSMALKLFQDKAVTISSVSSGYDQHVKIRCDSLFDKNVIHDWLASLANKETR